jgi:portal protein
MGVLGMSVKGELVRFGRELIGRPTLPDIQRGDLFGPTFQSYVDAYFQFQNHTYGPTGYTTTLSGEKVEPVNESFIGYVHGAYRSNGVVFAVSMARALLFTDITFKWRRYGQSGGGSDLFGTPELALLETPWPGGTTQSLLMRAEQDVTAGGTFFVAHEGDRLRRLRPDWCEFILSAPPEDAVQSDVVGIKHTTGGPRSGGQVTLYLVNPRRGRSKEGYAAFWSPIPDPDALYRGMSWLTPVLQEKQADQAATRHKLKFFENAATPNLAVTAPPELTPEQFKVFIRMMNESSQGVENAYKTLFLGGGATPTVIGASMQQMEFTGTQGHGETRICAAGRVPPIIVGLSEGLSAATYSNYAQARRAFGDSWARPQWKSFAGAISPLLDVPDNAQLWYDTRDVAFLREDTKDLAEVQSITMATINAALAAGWTPESSLQAVLAEDLSLLKHSGLMSVQLQAPGAGDEGPTDADDAGVVATQGGTIAGLLGTASFDPDSVVSAVTAGDLSTLTVVEPEEDPALAEEDPEALAADEEEVPG